MNGTPTNEQEFLLMFEIVTNISEERDAIYSTNQADFGVSWAQIETEVQNIKSQQGAK